MSAFPSKTDMCGANMNVHYGPVADIKRGKKFRTRCPGRCFSSDDLSLALPTERGHIIRGAVSFRGLQVLPITWPDRVDQ
jgi:hypothetical protein